MWDAMVYCSTCLSVGYGDIFAKTPMGKVLGSALMTIGPAVAAGTLDGKKREVDGTQEEILQTSAGDPGEAGREGRASNPARARSVAHRPPGRPTRNET